MIRLRFFVFIVALVLGPSSALWANPAVNLPTGNMHCSITVTPHDPTTPPPPPPKLLPGQTARAPDPVIKGVEITQVDNIRHNAITWSNGTTSEDWTFLDTGLVLIERKVNGNSSIYDMNKNSRERSIFFPLILGFDSNSTHWINPQNQLPDLTTFKGKAAIGYQKMTPLPSIMPGAPASNALYKAWVDPKTLTLLALDDGTFLYELTFSDPPAAPLTVPPRFQKEADLYRRAMARPVHL